MSADFFDFSGIGPLFVGGMVVLVLFCIVAGYWIGGKIGEGVESGIGGFFIILLISFMVAGGVFPVVVFAAMGDLFAMAMTSDLEQIQPSDAAIEGMLGGMLVGIVAGMIATIGFFVASLIGMGRARS